MILLSLLAFPAAAAVMAALSSRRGRMEFANVAASGAILALSIALAHQVVREGPVSAANGFFYADHLSALVVLLTSLVAFACSTYAVGYLREHELQAGKLDAAGAARPGGSVQGYEETENGAAALSRQRRYYTLTPLFVFSMLLVALSNNLGVMWVAIELTTLASVFLVTLEGRVTSLEAAWKYAIIGAVGLSMALFGTVLTYYSAHDLLGSGTLASLNWSVLAAHAGSLDKTTMRLAFILVLLGYGTKAGLAPMHSWKPDAYSEASVPTAALLASAALNCAIYGLARFYVLASGSLGPDYPQRLLLIFGLFSMGIAVPFVLVQKNLRRLLAYSSIDHAGIMTTALGIGGPLAAFGLMLHMTFHAVAKSLLFLCAGNVYQLFATDLFARIKGGVMRIMPLTGVVFLIAMLAIIGMPPFSLFQSEFVILRAAFEGGRHVSGVLFVLFTAGIFAGVLWHLSNLILGEPAQLKARPGRRLWTDASITALAAVLVIAGFWLPAPLVELIQGAARVVSGG